MPKTAKHTASTKDVKNPLLDESSRPHAEELADILLVLHRCFLQNLSQELDRGNVSFPQFFLLGHLSSLPKIAMSGIAEKMRHTTAAATGLVDRLEKMGYVERVHSEEDRRVVYVKITKKGLGIVAEVRQDMVGNLMRIMSGLSREEQNTWLKIYRGIFTSCTAPKAEG